MGETEKDIGRRGGERRDGRGEGGTGEGRESADESSGEEFMGEERSQTTIEGQEQASRMEGRGRKGKNTKN